MTDVIARGRALLAQRAAPMEMESTSEDAGETDETDDGPSECELMTQMCALMQLMIDRVDALERAMSAPRVRTPQRDETGKIVSVIDAPVPTAAPQMIMGSTYDD